MYNDLIDLIIGNIGGVNNIKDISYCMTRLRFVLNDNEKVNEDELKASPDIMTVQFVNNKFQVVVGTHVEKVYDEMQNKITHIEEDTSQNQESQTGWISRLIDTVTKIITPVLGILVASGLLQGLLALAVATNVLTETDGTYIVLNAMGQAAFYFFPVFLGFTSARTFGLNQYIGMLMGAILTLPMLEQGIVDADTLYVLFEGTIFSTPVTSTLFGIPIMFPPGGYTYSVIPIIFVVYIGAKIEKWLDQHVPEALANNVNAFLTVLITIPLALLIIGPITTALTQILEFGVNYLYEFSTLLTSIIVALIYQPLVIFGLHWGLSAIGLTNLAANGVDYIFPMSFTANFAQTGVVLAVFLRTKSNHIKGLAPPAMVSGLFNIIEPAIYGFSLPDKRRFAYSMLGGMVGAVILSLTESRMYAFSWGVLGITSFINPETGEISGMIWAVVASVAAFIVAFSLTYLSYLPAANEQLGREAIEHV